jgi:hypothetical protein
MKGLKGCIPAVVLVLLVTGLAAPPRALTRSPDIQAGPLAPQPPEMGPFIDIWTGDPIDNTRPAVAFAVHHNEFLVTWQNERLAMTDIYARRVAADGGLKSNFTVITAQNRWNQEPAMAYTPMQDLYLVAYSYNGPPPDTTTDIKGKFVGWNGAYLFPQMDIRVESGSQFSPAVAYNSQDDEFLVVYENWWANGLRDIAAQRIKASTGALASWRNIATGAGEWRYDPSVAYNEARNEYLITYTYSPNATTDNGDIYGRVVSANMATLSAEIPIVADGYDQQSSDVAAGPDEYLVVWSDGTAGTSDYDIYGRRVAGDGTPLASAGGFAIANATANRRQDPTVAVAGRCGYIVAWSYSEGGSPGWPPTVQDVYGAQVRLGANSVLGAEFAIDDGAYLQSHPALACTPTGQCLVVEQDNYPGTDGYEIRGRMLYLDCPHRVLLPQVLR